MKMRVIDRELVNFCFNVLCRDWISNAINALGIMYATNAITFDESNLCHVELRDLIRQMNY